MRSRKLLLIISLHAAIFQLLVHESSFAQLYDTAMQKYIMVKTWKGTISVNYLGSNDALSVSNSLNSTVYLTNEMGGMVMMWPYPDPTVSSRAGYSIQETYLEDCRYSYNSSGQMNWNVLMGIDIINKTFYLHCKVNDQVTGTFHNCDGETREELISFHPEMVDITDFPIEVSYVKPFLKGSKAYEVDGINVNVAWDLVPETGRSQVTIDPIDENWLPEDNSVITTKIQWDADEIPTKVKFTLYDISREPGTCLNSFERGVSLDLGFDPIWQNENHYEVTYAEENEITVERTSLELSNELTVSVKCFDYGASAKLKAQVLINNEWRTAIVKDGFDEYVTVPYDKDGDKIAEKWEIDNEVSSLAPDSDEDKLPTSDETGDAITLYEEYRGFFTLNPDKQHTRTNPNKREIFVIDTDELFSVPSWVAASGIMAYRLDNLMVNGSGGERDSRIVDYNQEYASRKHKYSIRLKKSDIFKEDGKYILWGEAFPEASLTKPPKYWDLTLIYLMTINNQVDNVLSWLITNERIPDDELKQKTGLSRETYNSLKRYINNPSAISTIKEFFINSIVIHEVGHSCGIKHHEPVMSGSITCPMKYKDKFDNFLFIKVFLDAALNFIHSSGDGEVIFSFADLVFCRDNFFCYQQIKTKDD